MILAATSEATTLRKFKDSKALEALTARPWADRGTVHIFYIKQRYSWSPLLVSEEMVRKLFTYLRVHPLFLDIMHIFGEKLGPVEESFTSFFVHNLSQGVLHAIPLGSNGEPGYAHVYEWTEIGYNIKYVEEHGREIPKDPWSIREMGIYQRYSSQSNQSNWICIQPSQTLQTEFRNYHSRAGSISMQYHMHTTILLIASQNWRFYINYLEETFAASVDKGFFTDIKRKPRRGDIEADFSDIRRLHILIDKFRRLSHILNLNLEIGTEIRDFMTPYLNARPSAAASNQDSMTGIQLFISQHQVHKARIDSLLQRADGIESLIQNILNFRNNQTANCTNESVRQLTEQSQDENRIMRELAQQSAQDTRSMMIIALMSAVFLPATFIATLFGSNFFGFNTTDGKSVLLVASNLWIYFLSTALLLTLTITGWWWRKGDTRTVNQKKELELNLDIEKQLDNL